MINKDLTALAPDWKDCLKAVTELSKDKKNGTPLVESGKQLYDFDTICGLLFPEDKKPASADGLEITPREVRLIEFKTGFRKKITRENFDVEKGLCKKAGEVCEDYWGLFFKKQKKDTGELISSIQFKAVESYLTLQKKLLPLCPEAGEPLPLAFIVVADADAVDGMVDILTGLSKRKEESRTSLGQIRSSLKKYLQLLDESGEVYCYDRVEVLTASQYANRVNT